MSESCPRSSSPLVSVIMPVRNGGAPLIAAINSILSQTFRGFEFLIVDDGSSDSTPRILEHFAKLDPRIRVISNRGSGITASLNTLVKEAKGLFVARQDADDLSHPCRLEDQVRLMLANPSVVLCCTAAQFLSDEGTPKLSFLPPPSNRSLKRDLERGLNPIIHGSVMLRKDALLALSQGYRGGHGEDLDLWLRLSQRGEFRAVGRIRYLYRVSAKGLSLSNLTAQRNLRKFIYGAHRLSRDGAPIEDYQYEQEVDKILKAAHAAETPSRSLLADSALRDAIRSHDLSELKRLSELGSGVPALKRAVLKALVAYPRMIPLIRCWHDLGRSLRMLPASGEETSPIGWIPSDAPGLDDSTPAATIAGAITESRAEFEALSLTPELTVLMAVRDERGSFLSRAIDSVLDQSLSNFEFLIVDDGSKEPETVETLTRYAELSTRIKIIRSSSVGLTRALNFGAQHARGALLARHDSDDWSAPTRFAVQSTYLNDNPTIEIAGTLSVICNAKGDPLWVKRIPHGEIDLQALKSTNPIAHGSWCMRTVFFRRLGGYDERFEFAQDYDFLLRAAQIGRIGVVREPLYNLRRHANARSAVSFALQRSYSTIARHGPVNDRFVERCLAEAALASDDQRIASAIVEADLALINGEPFRSLRAATSLLSRSPFTLDGWVRLVRIVLFPLAPLRPYLFRR